MLSQMNRPSKKQVVWTLILLAAIVAFASLIFNGTIAGSIIRSAFAP